jgi:hypothetical protein
MKDVALRHALLARQARLSASGSIPSTPAARGLSAAISRRSFVRGTGALVAAAAAGRAVSPQTAYAAGADPVPVPGSPNLAPFSVWAPIFVDSIDADPSSITNFNGVSALAYVSGTVHRTNMLTGEVDVLPFVDADMRFMQGVYRGIDGQARAGTFGFV